MNTYIHEHLWCEHHHISYPEYLKPYRPAAHQHWKEWMDGWQGLLVCKARSRS